MTGNVGESMIVIFEGNSRVKGFKANLKLLKDLKLIYARL